MSSRSIAITAAVVMAAAAAGCVSHATAQTRAAYDENLRQYRISFGWKDSAPVEWSGRVTVSGAANAELVNVRGWRFSGDDRATSDGQFKFKTRAAAPQGLTVRLRSASDSALIKIALTSPSSPPRLEFNLTATEAMNGNVRIERLPVETQVSESGMQDDEPALAVGPDGATWTAWLGYQDAGDWVVVSDGAVSTRITDKGDHQSPTIAVLPNGWVMAAWSQRDNGQEFHVYSSFRIAGRWSAGRRMTTLAGSHLWPQLATDPEGRAVLAWQTLREGQSAIRMRQFDGRNWGVEEPVSQDAGNAWSPAVFAASKRAMFAWDAYSSRGAYEVWFREWPAAPERVSAVSQASASRASLGLGPSGQAVIAWEQQTPGEEKSRRQVRLAIRDSTGVWRNLTGDPAESLPEPLRAHLQQPRIIFDSAGRLSLLFRCRTGASAQGGGISRWEVYLTRREGDRWIPAILLPESEGRNGMRIGLAADRSHVIAAWATDRRSAVPPLRYGDLDIHTARLALPGGVTTLSTTSTGPPSSSSAAVSSTHQEAAAKLRAYRTTLNGKEFRILRGDLHRHTDLSPAGAHEGSLDDLFRATIDTAQLDFAAVTDTQMGFDEEYNWWLTQKSTDIYSLPQRLLTLYGFARPGVYPYGHRLVLWPERGRPVLKAGQPEIKAGLNSGAFLYPYLNRTSGIAIIAAPASLNGTDWAEHNNAGLEPLAEVYEGGDVSYENPGGPRVWKEGDPASPLGLRRDGYLSNAWSRGLKVGVTAGSGFAPSRNAFTCVVAEEFSRASLFDALRHRHTYATTGAMILDYRLHAGAVTAFMGDAISSAEAPRLEVKIIGSAALAQVDIIKNGSTLHQVKPGQSEVTLTYSDSDWREGESYYYVRAEQTDGHILWSSPIWVRKQILVP